jgi:hypothetical protein
MLSSMKRSCTRTKTQRSLSRENQTILGQKMYQVVGSWNMVVKKISNGYFKSQCNQGMGTSNAMLTIVATSRKLNQVS